MDLRAAILSGILVFASLAFAPAADAQWNGGFQQDWGDECMGPDDPFCGGDEAAKKDCNKIVGTGLKLCKDKCKCTYDNDLKDCKLLRWGTAYVSCVQTAQRAKEQCDTICESS